MDAYSCFEQARALRIQLGDLKLDYKRMIPQPGSPKIDGMPKGGGADPGADWIDRRDRLERKIAEKETELAEVMRTVDAVMEYMPNAMYRFCLYYFVSAYPKEDVCTFLQISRRTFYNRMNSVFKVCMEYGNADSDCV